MIYKTVVKNIKLNRWICLYFTALNHEKITHKQLTNRYINCHLLNQTQQINWDVGVLTLSHKIKEYKLSFKRDRTVFKCFGYFLKCLFCSNKKNPPIAKPVDFYMILFELI